MKTEIPSNRHEILLEALERCYNEMFERAQPSVTWEQVNKNVLDGVYGEGVKDAYNYHYLSSKEYEDIREKYMYMYNIHDRWKDNAELMINYLKEGGTKDKWIPEKIHENGFKEPGYRGYEQVPSFEKHLFDILSEFEGKILNAETKTELQIKIVDKVFELMNYCKDFYRGDREVSNFIFSVMDLSPNSNKEAVIENWKKLGKDIEIIDKIEDPWSGELVFPEEIEGYEEGKVYNYDIDEWVTPEELEEYERKQNENGTINNFEDID